MPSSSHLNNASADVAVAWGSACRTSCCHSHLPVRILVLYDVLACAVHEADARRSHVQYDGARVAGQWPKTRRLFEALVQWQPAADFYVKIDDDARVDAAAYERALARLRPRYFGVSTLHWHRLTLLSACPRRHELFPYAQGSLYALDAACGRRWLAREHAAVDAHFRRRCGHRTRVLHEDRMVGYVAHAVCNASLTPAEPRVNQEHSHTSAPPFHTMDAFSAPTPRWWTVPRTLVTAVRDDQDLHATPFWTSCVTHRTNWSTVVALRDRDFDALLANTSERFVANFRALRRQISRVDLARYLYLYKHGGVYVDADYVCFPQLHAMEWGDGVFVTAEQYPKGCSTGSCQRERVGNAFMVSPPRHPFVGALLARVAAYGNVAMHESRIGPAALTGPGLLTSVLAARPWSRVRLLSFETAYGVSWYASGRHPCTPNMSAASCAAHFPSTALGTTLWSGSWLPAALRRPPPIAIDLRIHLPTNA